MRIEGAQGGASERFTKLILEAAVQCGIENYVMVHRDPDTDFLAWTFHGDPVWSVGALETSRVFLAANIAGRMGSNARDG